MQDNFKGFLKSIGVEILSEIGGTRLRSPIGPSYKEFAEQIKEIVESFGANGVSDVDIVMTFDESFNQSYQAMFCMKPNPQLDWVFETLMVQDEFKELLKSNDVRITNEIDGRTSTTTDQYCTLGVVEHMKRNRSFMISNVELFTRVNNMGVRTYYATYTEPVSFI